MRLLVVASTPIELNAVKKWIKSANIKSNLDIDFLCIGIWNYEVIYSLEHYFSIYTEPVFIWNVWICGYRNAEHKKTIEPVQISSVINVYMEKEYVCPPFLQLATFWSLISSESIITEIPKFIKEKWLINNMYYFDMESWWIELISNKHKFPSLILKVPFDFISVDSSLLFSKWNRVETIENVTKVLNNLSYGDYLNKILSWMSEQN